MKTEVTEIERDVRMTGRVDRTTVHNDRSQFVIALGSGYRVLGVSKSRELLDPAMLANTKLASCYTTRALTTQTDPRTDERPTSDLLHVVLRHPHRANARPCPSLVCHGVHTSPATVFPLRSIRPPPPDGRVRRGWGTNASEHAQLRQQVIDLPCQRALAFDAHDRIRLGDCLRHRQRRVE